MRKFSFLIPFFSLFIFHCAFSYTVILKSGKAVEGNWIAEDDNTIQLKDPQGVLLSLKKSKVDLSATAQRNLVTAKPVPEARPVTRNPSLVEIANESKKSRAGNARVVSQEDLNRAPAISVFGTTENTNARVEVDDTAPVPDRSERYWHEQAEKLKRAVSEAADKKREAEVGCARAREQGSVRVSKRRSNEVLILAVPAEPSECRRARELDARWEETNRRWLEFADRARREQVPWQWLE